MSPNVVSSKNSAARLLPLFYNDAYRSSSLLNLQSQGTLDATLSFRPVHEHPPVLPSLAPLHLN